MKKGDIVQLKESTLYNALLDRRGSSVYQIINAPKELTVAEMGSMSICGCSMIETVQFEELDAIFDSSAFNVILEAGEPDVAKLLEESKQTEIAWIGF